MLTCASCTHEQATILDHATPDLELERCEADRDDCYEDLNYQEKEIVSETNDLLNSMMPSSLKQARESTRGRV